MPRVTVLTATYNWATVLPFSIGSVLDQSFTDYELLVIGDGCTDESGELVGAIEDPRVRWCNLPSNAGHQAGPNNEGIRQARGDLIAYLGHDDLWLPDHLAVLVEAIDAGSSVVHASMLRVVPQQQPTAWPPPGWAYRPGFWMPPTTLMHDRGLARSVGGWRMPRDTGKIDAEADLLLRLAWGAGRLPMWVARLTSVKLPATRRSDVYRQRPCHEQAYWLGRIRDADDPEQSLLAAMQEPYPYANPDAPDPGDLPGSAEARRRARRRFKGIED